MSDEEPTFLQRLAGVPVVYDERIPAGTLTWVPAITIEEIDRVIGAAPLPAPDRLAYEIAAGRQIPFGCVLAHDPESGKAAVADLRRTGPLSWEYPIPHVRNVPIP